MPNRPSLVAEAELALAFGGHQLALQPSSVLVLAQHVFRVVLMRTDRWCYRNLRLPEGILLRLFLIAS
eukprot:4771724-Amphidinium_carterae.1